MRLTRVINNIRRLIKVFRNSKYAVCPTAENLDRKHFTALNIGAVNAEQNMYFCNCLETDPDKTDVMFRIRDYYGIVDRNTAIDVLGWLYQRGHAVFFETVKPLISNRSDVINTDGLTEEEKGHALNGYVENIKETLNLLVQRGIIRNGREFERISIKAWDLGRLVLVARCCFDVGLITREEAWNYILQAYETCRALYPTWKNFAAGYLIGRCMWSGEDCSLYGIFNIADGLLNDPESPWRRYPLR